MLHFNVPFVLASRSPRRSDLLRRLGLTFEVLPGDVEELLPTGMAPGPAVEAVAKEKAEHVAGLRSDALVLSADTIVVLEDEVLGKPRDRHDAERMLRRLASATHAVFTGIALVHRPSDRLVTAHARTEVTFAPMSDDEIAAYVRTGSPLDKAGAYGIQDDLGALFVSEIRGDYYNVVGLPLNTLYHVLKDHFSDLLASD